MTRFRRARPNAAAVPRATAPHHCESEPAAALGKLTRALATKAIARQLTISPGKKCGQALSMAWQKCRTQRFRTFSCTYASLCTAQRLVADPTAAGLFA